MKTLNDIYTLIEECNIILEYHNLPNDVLGIYHGDENFDLIIINRYIEGNEMLHRIILAEELGHYFTTIGNNIPKKYIKKRGRLNIDICEQKAMRWSLNYLVPTKALIDYINQQDNTTLEDCCNYFEVPMDLMTIKFEIMTLEGVSWKPNKPNSFTAHMSQFLTS